jgi:hypothetical protein
MTPSRSDLLALARKYRAMSELRRAQHQVTRSDVLGSLRSLAREFPGALRELDSLPLEEIEERVELLETAARFGIAARWMEWMYAYHLTMRAALGIKRRLGGRRSISEFTALEIAGDVAVESGYRCDLEFVLSVARPPEGRINVVVFQRLGSVFGIEPQTLWRALFPERRAQEA